jgi:anti-sigma regulatory factor (Ser/Thr protein kinase)
MASVTTAAQPPAPWPLRTPLEVTASVSAPGIAREHAQIIARHHGLAEIADITALVTSELVTNAVQASALLAGSRPPCVIRVWITAERAGLIVHVWDASPGMPVLRQAAPDQERGRGLMLVDSLTEEWGAYCEAGGKVVWALIR